MKTIASCKTCHTYEMCQHEHTLDEQDRHQLHLLVKHPKECGLEDADATTKAFFAELELQLKEKFGLL